MEERPRFSVGIDLGTNTVRAVMGRANPDGTYSVIGYGEASSEGVRRGTISNIAMPVQAINNCLAQVEQMGGIGVDGAAVGVNGAHLASTRVDGMIAVGVADHEINEDDLDRIIETSTIGKIPTNREILATVPYEYILDGQGGIREPLGMQGARLEIRANIVSALKPECDNLDRVFENCNLGIDRMMPSVMATADVVSTNKQRENGVGILNIGGATTSLAVYDEGELQYLAVVPIGSDDITRDLATILKTVPEVAEEIKLRFASCVFGETEKDIVIKQGRNELSFVRADVDEVVEARLEEIFEAVRKHLKNAKYDRRLPEGIILSGGGSKMRGIEDYAREQLELAVRRGQITSKIRQDAGDAVLKPEFTTALGLMIADGEAREHERGGVMNKKKNSSKKKKGDANFIGGFLKLFK